MSAAHQNINQDSGNTEWYTDPVIIEAARRTMGNIDLDPASSERANQFVRASHFFTEKDDSLNRPWFGRVWMNHPYGRVNNKLWIEKLLYEYGGKHMNQACCITFDETSERWFQPLLALPQCFLSPRTNYFSPDGTKKTGVTKGSVVTYMGDRPEVFNTEFRHFGTVKIAY